VALPIRALAGFAKVKLMQELAGGALLAEAAHPVLADEAIVGVGRVMLIGTGVAGGAVALLEGFACRAIRVEAEAVFALEEGFEVEGEARRVVGGVEELVDDGCVDVGGHNSVRVV